MKNKLLLPLLFSIISCTNNSQKNNLLNLVSELGSINYLLGIQHNDNSTYVIIPNAGYSGCISESENFMKQNIDNPNFIFVLTNFISEKSVKLKLGETMKNKKNIFLDKHNLVFKYGFDSIYLSFLTINGNQMIMKQIKPS